MPNSLIKSILSCLALLVLCIVVGSFATEDYIASTGIIVLLVGFVALLILGDRCWVLIFILPPLMAALPVNITKGIPYVYIVSIGVMGYWMLLNGLGHVRFCWRSMWGMDLLVLLMFGLLVASYIRHPVSIRELGLEADLVGGRIYAIALCATLYYLAMSTIPMRMDLLCKVLKWAIPLSVAMAALRALFGAAGVGVAVEMEESLEAAVTEGRFLSFMGVGTCGVYYIYARYPVLRIITSPVLLSGMLASAAAMMLSGFRGRMVIMGLNVAAMSIAKRELSLLIIGGCFAYAGVLVLSAGGITTSMPYGIQRSLSFLPGVKVQSVIKREAQHSVDWRVEVWQWALDTRTGYIQDYTWGDGFGLSMSLLKRRERARMRGETSATDVDGPAGFASVGLWHSGWITAIHRLGVVGLCSIALFFVYATIMVHRTGNALRGSPLFYPALYLVYPFAFEFFSFFASAGTIEMLYVKFASLGYMKLFYCEGRRVGWIKPLSFRRTYVPLMIQEHGGRISSECHKSSLMNGI